MANAAERYRRNSRTGSEWIHEDPPAAATLVIPKATLTEFMAITNAQIPWIAAVARAAKDSLVSLVSSWFFSDAAATSRFLACSCNGTP